MNTILLKGGKIPETKRIVFLGDSITEDGTYIAHLNHYFFQHHRDKKLELINLGVSSETVSGLSEPDHPFPRPCVHERINEVLQLSQPEWVVVCYGMNDGIYYPWSQERFTAYKEGLLNLIEKIKASGAKIIVMTPPPFDKSSFKSGLLLPEGSGKFSYLEPYEEYTEVLKQYGDWIMTDLTEQVDQLVDIYAPLSEYIREARKDNSDYFYGDGIHPGMDGHWVISKALLKALFHICLERRLVYLDANPMTNGFDLTMKCHKILSASWKEYVGHTHPNKLEAMPLAEAKIVAKKIEIELEEILKSQAISSKEILSDWKGYKRHDFYFKGREAIWVEPKNAAPGNPWIWRTEFFDAFSNADMAMLESGWNLVYYRISNLYGCSEAIDLMNVFHEELVNTYLLSEKTVLFGFSRGGLYAVNYAIAYPNKIALIYLDAPVLDILSWPGGKGLGIGSQADWEECLTVYGFHEEEVEQDYQSPLMKSDMLVKAGIPILIVAGDLDEVVPFEENAAKLVKSYHNLGGELRLILKEGVGHHPHSLENSEVIVNYIVAQTKDAYLPVAHI